MAMFFINMDREMEFRAKLTEIGDCVDRDLLDNLIYIHFKEPGIREKIHSFLYLITKLQERNPSGFIEELMLSCEKRNRNDIVQKLILLYNSYDISHGIMESIKVDSGNAIETNFNIKGNLMEDRLFSRTNEAKLNLSLRSINSKHGLICLSKDPLEIIISKKNNPELRNYQIELAQEGLAGRNTIICAPTGSGKTVIAAYICRELIEMNPEIKIIFIVSVRSLAKQQADILSDILGRSVFNNPDVLLHQCFQESNAVVLTHQILINELKMNTIELQDIDLLIFDECHHTKLDHPYNQLMNLYHTKKLNNERCKLPQIIGLTASLGTDNSSSENEILQHFANLCTRLDSNIKIVEDENNKDELLRSNPKPSKDQIILCSPRKSSSFYLKLTIFMTEIEDDYKISISSIKGSKSYQNEIIAIRKCYETQEGNMDKILVCHVLELINESLVFYDDATEVSAVNFLYHGLEFLYENDNLKNLMEKVLKVIEEVADVYCDIEAWKSNEKLVKLCSLLEKMSDQDATCIILARTCRIAKFLYDFLQNHNNLKDKLYCLFMVGQTNDEFGMSESQQLETLSTFKRVSGKKCSVLIATNVVQEGLDYPKCNLVIRYNFVGDEIATVQSRGRARAPDSQIFLIVDTNSVNVRREYDNLMKEREMLKVLESLADKRVQFEDMLKKAKDDLYKKIDKKIKDEKVLQIISQDEVSIHCITCKNLMCHCATVKRHPAGFISLDSEIETRTDFEKYSQVKDFKHDERPGSYLIIPALVLNNAQQYSNVPSVMKCMKCSNKICEKMRFKNTNGHQYGYILKKDKILWKRYYDRTYNHIPRKWDQLPFRIDYICPAK